MLSFEERKRDHIQISLSSQSQSLVDHELENIELIHEAIPDLNFSDIQLATTTLNLNVDSPIFVSSMTLGHAQASSVNDVLASVCQEKNMLMGVGSQRKQLKDREARQECVQLRQKFPRLKVMGNIGLAQLIETPTMEIAALVESLEAQAMIVHTNPLQECIQPEGTPQFRGSWQALERLCHELTIPVILKETGCGFSEKTLARCRDLGLAAIDVSGRGGTHWGRVEAQRLNSTDVRFAAGQSFRDWGISTVESVLAARNIITTSEIWASGGVRSGLDVAKYLALGSSMVGVAQPILASALQGQEALNNYIEQIHYELKVAMFCVGAVTVADLRKGDVWKKIKN